MEMLGSRMDTMERGLLEMDKRMRILMEVLGPVVKDF